MNSAEELTIERFLVLKEIKLPLNKINVLIGPQASGKSLTARTLFFFKETLWRLFMDSIFNEEQIDTFKEKVGRNFEAYFPSYLWEKDKFRLHYKDIRFEISIENKNEKLHIQFNDKLRDYYEGFLNKIKQFKSKEHEKSESIENRVLYQYALKETLRKEHQVKEEPVFIPASRTFFSLLSERIFAISREDISLDPIIKNFGSNLELVRNLYKFFLKRIKADHKLFELTKKLLGGEYKFIEKTDWLHLSIRKKIKIKDASSGQQEILPLLLVLLVYNFIGTPFKRKNHLFIIEEPEAHLFPQAQRDLIFLIGKIYNNGNNFFITTHSPYILSALNNLVIGYETYKTIKKENQNQVERIIDKDSCINFDDINVWTIEKGKCKLIMDKDNRLINTNIIDSVSEDINSQFEALIDLLHRENTKK